MEHVALQNSKYTFDPVSNLQVLVRCKNRKDPPYGKVSVGDTIYILQDGLIGVKYTVSSAQSIEYSDIKDIRDQTHGTTLYTGKSYWETMADRRYGTVVKLANYVRLSNPIRPLSRSFGWDWYVLDTQEKRNKWLGQ